MTEVSIRAHDRNSVAAAFVALTVALVALHAFTGVRNLPNVRDEELMKVPIDAILERGWSVETAIDYQEVKGPVFYWMYALPAEVIRGDINALRMISTGYFLLGGLALLLIGQKCGMRGSKQFVLAGLYALAPYNSFTALLLMSEPSFTCIGMWLTYAFVVGFAAPEGSPARRLALIALTILFAILLHHRPHAVALGGAAVMTAFARDRFRAWPWLVACAVAALLRLPLYFRWGGMVTSHYQELFGFGVRLDGLVYMLGAVLPWTVGWLVWPLFYDHERLRRAALLMLAAAGAGAVLAIACLPDLNAKVEYTVPGSTEIRTQIEYAGVLATAVKAIMPSVALRQVALITLAGLGAASLVGLFLARPGDGKMQPAARDPISTAHQLAFWMLACGLPLYVVTAGPVYDRYLVVWMILMPIAWLATLPRVVLIAQVILYSAMMAYSLYDWIISAQ